MSRKYSGERVPKYQETLSTLGFSTQDTESIEGAAQILQMLSIAQLEESVNKDNHPRKLTSQEHEAIQLLLDAPELGVTAVEPVAAGRAQRLGADFIVSSSDTELSFFYLRLAPNQRALNRYIRRLQQKFGFEHRSDVFEMLREENIIAISAKEIVQLPQKVMDVIALIIDAQSESSNSATEK